MSAPSTSLSLAGLNALVIGGSSGIGEAIAHGYAEAGARVAIAARSPDKLDAAAARLAAAHPGSKGYVADVTADGELARLAETVTRDLGPIDVLVPCQGTTIIKPTLDFTQEEVEFIVRTNQTSVFFSCTVFGRLMLERGSGAIVNIASLSAHRGWPKACPYAMTKHAVVGLTQTLAAEWAPQGVRVNAISPGFFMTELNAAKMPPDRKENALRRTPMGRWGKTQELVGAAVYLASPAASFVTGTVIAVDGGYLASGI
ncbi:SDR family NAD(P)-dependent oxidoreductase [Phreatobacter cathodiphilus]|nr:SDR family oxidoreductase [Phreatobacter cathodiphilus]